MTSRTLHRMLASAGILLSGTALAACASAATAGPRAPVSSSGAPASSPGAPARSAAAGYPGYRWRLVSVSHEGKVTPIPVRYTAYLQFSPDGQFTGSDGTSALSATYRAASDAFTTSNMATSANGYANGYGNAPTLLLTLRAMASVVEHARHPVQLTGDQLVVNMGPYVLTFHRAGRQANLPVPTGTG